MALSNLLHSSDLSFVKYTGAGNDFILLEREGISSALVTALCDRHFGVGADGVIILFAAADADFAFQIYNSDGSSAGTCGNGVRCAAHWWATLHKKTHCQVRGPKATYQAEVKEAEVTLNWPLPHQEVRVIKENVFFVDTGVPHILVITGDQEKFHTVNWTAAGKRWQKEYDANINLMLITPEGVKLRTKERGVDQETLACGSGVVAAAWVAHTLCGLSPTVVIEVRSLARCTVTIEGDQMLTTGPVKKVFEGRISGW